MYSILKKTSSALFGTAVILSSFSHSVFAESSYSDFQAGNQADTAVSSQGLSDTDLIATESMSVPSVNPYRAGFTQEYAVRIDKVVAGILARGKDLPQDRYIVYLSSISSGIKTLVQKPAYQNNAEVRNIADYISYEIDTVKNGLSNGDTFMDDLPDLIDQALRSSTESKNTSEMSAGSGSASSSVNYRAEVIAMFAGNALAHAYAPVPGEDLISAWTAEIKARGLAATKVEFPIAVDAYVEDEIRKMYNSNLTAKLYLPNGPDQASIDYWKTIIEESGPTEVMNSIFPDAVEEYASANPL